MKHDLHRNPIWKFALIAFLSILAICPTGFVQEPEPTMPAHQLGKSYLEIATDYLMEKDLKMATQYYRLWLAASPRDMNAWYNLACCWALSGEKMFAVDAFEKAVESGWSDADHARQDTDLDLIREESRFKAALAQCEKQTEITGGPQGYQRQTLEMSCHGTYIVALPPDYETSGKTYPVCVILHGRGSSELRHGELADTLGRDGIIYVAPRSPYPVLGGASMAKEGAYSIWPPFDIPGEVEPEIVPESVEWVFACVKDVQKKYRTEGKKVFILGHSQGAGLANACALLHPEKVSSYLAYAGFLPELLKNDKYFQSLKRKKVKPVIVHCTEDTVVPIASSREIETYLKRAGATYTFQELHGDHRINDGVHDIIQKWLDTEVRHNPRHGTSETRQTERGTSATQ